MCFLLEPERHLVQVDTIHQPDVCFLLGPGPPLAQVDMIHPLDMCFLLAPGRHWAQVGTGRGSDQMKETKLMIEAADRIQGSIQCAYRRDPSNGLCVRMRTGPH